MRDEPLPAAKVCPVCQKKMKLAARLADPAKCREIKVDRCSCGQIVWDDSTQKKPTGPWRAGGQVFHFLTQPLATNGEC